MVDCYSSSTKVGTTATSGRLLGESHGGDICKVNGVQQKGHEHPFAREQDGEGRRSHIVSSVPISVVSNNGDYVLTRANGISARLVVAEGSPCLGSPISVRHLNVRGGAMTALRLDSPPDNRCGTVRETMVSPPRPRAFWREDWLNDTCGEDSSCQSLEGGTNTARINDPTTSKKKCSLTCCSNSSPTRSYSFTSTVLGQGQTQQHLTRTQRGHSHCGRCSMERTGTAEYGQRGKRLIIGAVANANRAVVGTSCDRITGQQHVGGSVPTACLVLTVVTVAAFIVGSMFLLPPRPQLLRRATPQAQHYGRALSSSKQAYFSSVFAVLSLACERRPIALGRSRDVMEQSTVAVRQHIDSEDRGESVTTAVQVDFYFSSKMIPKILAVMTTKGAVVVQVAATAVGGASPQAQRYFSILARHRQYDKVFGGAVRQCYTHSCDGNDRGTDIGMLTPDTPCCPVYVPAFTSSCSQTFAQCSFRAQQPVTCSDKLPGMNADACCLRETPPWASRPPINRAHERQGWQVVEKASTVTTLSTVLPAGTDENTRSIHLILHDTDGREHYAHENQLVASLADFYVEGLASCSSVVTNGEATVGATSKGTPTTIARRRDTTIAVSISVTTRRDNFAQALGHAEQHWVVLSHSHEDEHGIGGPDDAWRGELLNTRDAVVRRNVRHVDKRGSC